MPPKFAIKLDEDIQKPPKLSKQPSYLVVAYRLCYTISEESRDPGKPVSHLRNTQRTLGESKTQALNLTIRFIHQIPFIRLIPSRGYPWPPDAAKRGELRLVVAEPNIETRQKMMKDTGRTLMDRNTIIRLWKDRSKPRHREKRNFIV